MYGMEESRVLSPKALLPFSPRNTPRPKSTVIKRRNSVFSPYPDNIKSPMNVNEFEEEPNNYDSPTFDQVEIEFKDMLISFMSDLLLNNLDLIKNFMEFGNKILFRSDQLKQLMAILYLK
jgi:hypothetical protein